MHFSFFFFYFLFGAVVAAGGVAPAKRQLHDLQPSAEQCEHHCRQRVEPEPQRAPPKAPPAQANPHPPAQASADQAVGGRELAAGLAGAAVGRHDVGSLRVEVRSVPPAVRVARYGVLPAHGEGGGGDAEAQHGARAAAGVPKHADVATVHACEALRALRRQHQLPQGNITKMPLNLTWPCFLLFDDVA